MRAGILVTTLMMLPCAVPAQAVRGVVAHGDVPVPGVVVHLIDSTGQVVSRALSNAAGEYRVPAPGAGTFRLRTLRIGFKSVTSEPLALLFGQEAVRQLTVNDVAIRLDTVRVAERNACGDAVEGSAGIATALEQLRTALTAAQLTAGNRSVTATIVTYERTLDPNNDRVRQQASGISSGFTVRPWKALSAAELRRVGYVVTDAVGVTTYYAPDLDVLTSPLFIADHCFRAANSRDPSRLGIAFEPTRDRSRVPEIRGTIWLDRATSELRSLEYRYENISREQEGHRAGGEMEFARMTDGGWAIARWHIRMPVLELVIRGAERETRVAEVLTVGGELALAIRGQDTVFTRPPLVLAGTVLDSISDRPVPGARLRVQGTSLGATADARGRFAISDLLPGVYEVEVRTSAMDSIGAHVQWPVTFTDGQAPVTLRLPTPAQVARARAAVFAGIVTDTARQPVGGASVLLPAIGLRAETDGKGAFRVNDVPPGTHQILVRHLGYGALDTTMTFAPRQVVQRVVQLSRVQVVLDTISVTALADFEENRRLGLGHFLTRADLERAGIRQLGSVLSDIPGAGMVRGRGGMQAYVLSTRAQPSAATQQCFSRFASTSQNVLRSMQSTPGCIPPWIWCPESSEVAQGLTCNCYAKVFLDRTLMNRGEPTPPFDVNTISAERIEAIEYYAAPSQTPLKYKMHASQCGVLVIHTRRS